MACKAPCQVSATRRRHQRGNAVLEGALVMSVFVFMFLGIADFAQITFLQQSIAERARFAARSAISGGYDDTAIKNLLVYNQPTVPDSQAVTGLFGLSPSNVTVQRLDDDSTEQRIYITVTNYRFTSISPLLGRTYSNIPVRVVKQLEYEI
jgi:Flp pilus assembly protein TadG